MTMTTVDLRAEAAAEARRLRDARGAAARRRRSALVRLEGDAAWIAMPRRARLKREARRRMCLVWRVAFEDASGRLVESRLVPVLVDLKDPPAAARRCGPSFLLRAADLIRARVEKACEAWRIKAGDCSARSSVRARRERAITRPATVSGAAHNPACSIGAPIARKRHVRRPPQKPTKRAARLRTILDTAQIAPMPARLLLVLLP